MRNPTLTLLFFWVTIFSGSTLLAQQQFDVTIELPSTIPLDDIEVYLEDLGKTKKLTPVSRSTYQLVFGGDYTSLFAVLRCSFKETLSSGTFANIFFVQGKPAKIIIKEPAQKQFPFGTYQLYNAWDFAAEKHNTDEYTFKEKKALMDYWTQYKNKMGAGDKEVWKEYNMLNDVYLKKKLAFVCGNPLSYWSFYTFRDEIVYRDIVSADSLFSIFNLFPVDFRHTDEGNAVNSVIHSKAGAPRSAFVTDFQSMDIHQQHVTLSGFRGEKYVLLHFWATWCSPCVAELPALKILNKDYAGENVKFISIAHRSTNDADFLSAIKKYEMDWIHIYNDEKLFDLFGNQATPRICLIDLDGKKVYDSFDFPGGDQDMLELKRVLSSKLNGK
jgi:thiol-disulfide isomerase/thioredoxin